MYLHSYVFSALVYVQERPKVQKLKNVLGEKLAQCKCIYICTEDEKHIVVEYMFDWWLNVYVYDVETSEVHK